MLSRVVGVKSFTDSAGGRFMNKGLPPIDTLSLLRSLFRRCGESPVWPRVGEFLRSSCRIDRSPRLVVQEENLSTGNVKNRVGIVWVVL